MVDMELRKRRHRDRCIVTLRASDTTFDINTRRPQGLGSQTICFDGSATVCSKSQRDIADQ